MKTILTAGTFDILHASHIQLLERAKSLGDRLIVMCSTDDFNTKKHKEALQPYAERKLILEALRCVDKVVPEASWEDKAKYIKAFNVSTFVMGDDWLGKFDALKDAFPELEIFYFPRGKISSTHLRDKIKNL